MSPSSIIESSSRLLKNEEFLIFLKNNELKVWKTIKKKGECGSYYRTMKYVIY